MLVMDSMFSQLDGRAVFMHTVNGAECPTPAAGSRIAQMILSRASYYARLENVDTPPHHPTAFLFGELSGSIGGLKCYGLPLDVVDPEPVHEALVGYNEALLNGIAGGAYNPRDRFSLRARKGGTGSDSYSHNMKTNDGTIVRLHWGQLSVVGTYDGLNEVEREYVGRGVFEMGYVGLRMAPIGIEAV